MTSTSFTWSNPPAQVYVSTNPLPIIYWRNRNSEKIFSFPLTVDIKQEDVPKVAYLIRRYYADYMRKFLQEQITKNGNNGGESSSSLSERLQIPACLPIKALDLNNNITITNVNNFNLINGGKLINWFIYIISLIFPPKSLNVNETFYIRNENIGVASMEVSDIIKEVLRIYTVTLNNNETDSMIGGGEGGGILSLSNLFKLLSEKILKILKTGHKNGQKLKTKRGAAVVAAVTGKRKVGNGGGGGGGGGIDGSGSGGECAFDTQLEYELRNCVTGVEDRIKMFRDAISLSVTDESNTDTWAVKQFIKQIYQQQQQQGEIEPIYLNVNITFRTMFHAVGEIMNVVCLKIMPRLSLADSLGASIFHILYLKDLNLLESFVEQINLPVLTRLINACFVDYNSTAVYSRSKNSPIIYDILSSLPTLCCEKYELHEWITMNEENYTQGIHDIVMHLLNATTTTTTTTTTGFGVDEEELYYGINCIRGCTIEYYTIRLICHYIVALTISGSGKHIKNLNKKNLISCLYRITACVYHYVKTIPPHLLNANILTDNTFGSNPVYKKIIHKALEDFLCVNIPLLSESSS